MIVPFLLVSSVFWEIFLPDSQIFATHDALIELLWLILLLKSSVLFSILLQQMMAESIESELTDTSSLFLEHVCNFQLCPYEVCILCDLIHDFPPKTASHDPFYNSRVVAESHKEFQRFVCFFSRFHVKAVCEVYPEDEVAICVEFVFYGDFSNLTWCLGKSKHEEIFLVGGWAMSTDVLFDFFVDGVWKAALQCIFWAVFFSWAEILLFFSFLALRVGPYMYVRLHLHHFAGLTVLAKRFTFWFITAQFLLKCHLVKLEVFLEQWLDFPNVQVVAVQILAPFFLGFFLHDVKVPAMWLHFRHLRELLECLCVCEVNVLGAIQLPDFQFSIGQLHQPSIYSLFRASHFVLKLHPDHCRRGHFPYKFLITVLIVLIREVGSLILTGFSLQLSPCDIATHTVWRDAKDVIRELVSRLLRSWESTLVPEEFVIRAVHRTNGLGGWVIKAVLSMMGVKDIRLRAFVLKFIAKIIIIIIFALQIALWKIIWFDYFAS